MKRVISHAKVGWYILACALLVALGVAGCGSGDDSTSETAGDGTAASSEEVQTIGFISADPGSPFWITTSEGAEEAGDELPDADVVVGSGPGGGDFAGMIPVIQDMMTREVDALVVPGIEQLATSLEKVAEEEIPIIFYADSIPGSDLPVSTVNTDSVKGGELAGEYLNEKLGGSGSLAILRYPKGQYPSIDDRVTGVENGVQGTDIEITYLDPGCDSEAPSVEAMQNLLTRTPDLNAVFGECGAPGLGALKAINQAGIDPGDVVVVTFDGSEAEIQAIIDGELDAAVSQYPHKMGKLAVETANMVLQGETVPEEIDSGTILITGKNAEEELHTVR